VEVQQLLAELPAVLVLVKLMGAAAAELCTLTLTVVLHELLLQEALSLF